MIYSSSGRRGLDRMVVRFTTTYATIAHICSNCALILYVVTRGRRGRDRMVARFTTTYATIAYICSNCALILYLVTGDVGVVIVW